MVRTRILHSSKALAIFALSLLTTFAFAGEMTGENVIGQVSGNRAVFPALSDEILVAKKLSATLELTFQTASEFSAEQVSIITNGLQCTASSHRIRALAQWKFEGGVRKLVLEMDSLRFGNQEPFLDKVCDVIRHHGSLALDVRAPFALRTAKLVFEYEVPPPPLPTVQLTKVDPADSVIQSRTLAFTFSSVEGAKLFECRHRRDSDHWMSCSSPKVFTDLKNGRHHFAFRAIDKLGRVGPVTRYRTYVDAPNPAVIFTSIIPKENPTTSTTMQIGFQLNGSGGNYVECNLDNKAWAWCSSPVLFKSLSEGAHKAIFRRPNWIYSTLLGHWLGEFAWFQAICPLYSDPVVYSWVVQRGIPSAELVSTPKALTKESVARFEFRSDVTARFQCRVDGNAAVECVSPVQFNVSEGIHVFEVIPYVENVFNNAVSFRWEVDQSAPELTLGSVIPAELVTSASTLSLGFVSSESATFRCALDGASATNCGTPVNVTGLADGAHELSVVATDAAGNESDALLYDWTVDRQAPGAKAQMTFPASLPTKFTRAVFEFMTNENATFRCSVDGVDRGACVSPFEVTNLAEGQHEFSVMPVDAVGNVGVAATIQWMVDVTLPLIRVTAVEPPESATESHSMRIDFDTSEPATVLCELDGGGQLPCHSPYLASGVAEGNHQLEIIAVDAAQNVSRAYRHPWRVDSVAIVQISSVVPDAAVVSSRSLLVEFGSTNSASFVCSLDGAPTTACASPVQFSELADGAHTFEVHGLNLSGNIGPAAGHVWTVDTAGPVVTLDSVNPSTSPTASKDLTLSFSSADAASYLCMLDSAAEAPCASPVALSEVAEGAHKFSLVGIDGLGNRGNPAAYEWSVDATGPTVAFGNVTPSGAVVAALSLTADFVANEPVSFLCALDGGAEAACASPYKVDVAEGAHDLVLVGIDALGNRGLPVTYHWVVLVPEAIARIDGFSPERTPTTSQVAAVTFSGTDAVSFVCKLDDAAFAACVSGIGYSNLAEGAHTFSVAGVNLAHRQGPALSRAWVVDRTGPVVQILSTNPSLSPTAALALTAYFSASETATFRCQLDGASETECVAPLTISVGEGEHTLSISGIDVLGNRGAATVHSWTVSVPEALVTLTSVVPSAPVTQSRTFTTGFAGTDAVSFECRLDGAAFAACASPFVVTGLVDGSHQFEVRGVNAVGRPGLAQAHGWTVDNVGPAASLTSFEPAASPTTSRQMTLVFSADEAGATFTCALDDGVAVACTSPVLFAGLADGSHQVTVRAADGLGNVGQPAIHAWVVDATGPVTSFISLVPAGSTSSLTLTAAFSANETATFNCSLDGGAEVSCASPHTVTVGEGNHTFAVVGIDALGNRGAATVHSWTVSVPEALVTLTSVVPIAPVTQSRTFTAGFVGTDAVSFECRLDGAAFAACAGPFVVTGLVDGSHQFEVRGVNAVGRPGLAQAHGWTVDNVGPAASLTSFEPASSPTTSRQMTLVFSADEGGATFTCALDDGAAAACTSPVLFAGLTDGAHQVTVRAADVLGNVGQPAIHAWVIDATAPVTSFISLVPAGSTSSLTLTAAFSANETATFNCSLDGGAEASCASPHTVTVGEGSHTFAVVGSDTLGNRGAAVIHTWTVTVPEVFAQIDAFMPSQSPAASRTAFASFSGVNAASFRCSVDGAAYAACASPQNYSGLSDGAHAFAVVAVNAVGKVGGPASRSWVVDTTGPVTHFDSTLPSTSPTSSLSLTAVFSANESAEFRCSLDGASEVICTSPYTVNVGQGAHSLAIAGIDALSNRGATVTYSWAVAIPAATASITSTTPSAALTKATAFSADFTGANAVSFECRLDGAAFAACASPFSRSALADGAHIFQVRGVNGASEAGVAASHSWTIDTVGPNATLLSVTPDWSPTSNNTLTASFTANEAGATFACRLDSAAEAACSSPFTFTGLADGTHHISIAALDSLGNRGLPATHDWIVDSTALKISNVSVTNVTSNSARIEWSTNFVSNSQVKYGTGANLNQTSPLNGTNVLTHSVVLTGLSSFTFYSAQAVSVDRDGRTVQSTVVTFRTLRP